MKRGRGARRRSDEGPSASTVRLVRLDEDSPENDLLRRALFEHRLPPEQLRFTGLPPQTLVDADHDAERVPYTIVATERTLTDLASARAACAGFGVLDQYVSVDLVDAPETAVLLRAYYVTPQWQGRGIGRSSCSPPLLDGLVGEAAPHATQIVLCVNEANYPAQSVYRAAGFAPTGTRVPGSAGPQMVMSRLWTPGHPAPHPRHERTENPQ